MNPAVQRPRLRPLKPRCDNPHCRAVREAYQKSWKYAQKHGIAREDFDSGAALNELLADIAEP